jgi:hypothetical protein
MSEPKKRTYAADTLADFNLRLEPVEDDNANNRPAKKSSRNRKFDELPVDEQKDIVVRIIHTVKKI